eukprot:TRINITY_DN110358_c0_g1_i1.p1 TRINITY_DN110358_c0_g1~~TRINITY_DN110358_c0_g1_i1.p1  ORF type:complete len:455 (-),score=34.66 TRINITY_DN110358_c0_g1_i1:317-1681(-)
MISSKWSQSARSLRSLLGRSGRVAPSLAARAHFCWQNSNGLLTATSPCYHNVRYFSGCASRSKNSNAAGSASTGSAKTVSPNLARVKSIVAIASCKGGVGKSSITVNLAYMLQQQGKRVGILDVDIYGPSLPFMIPSSSEKVNADQSTGVLQPVTHENCKLMSLGFLRPGQHMALRGPMVSGIAQQLLLNTDWGDLDYLLLDMPPGTGDIHLTIAQSAAVDAAVMVTTPQKLSLVDVEKGIRMFDVVKIPTVGIIENMSMFECPHCGKESSIYYTDHQHSSSKSGATGPGPTDYGAKYMSKMFGIECFHSLPIDPYMARPKSIFALEGDSTRAAWRELWKLAENLDAQVTTLKKSGSSSIPALEFDRARSMLVLKTGKGTSLEATARNVRLACRSASMWDEFTGKKLFKDEDIPNDVVPKSIESAGRYAVKIDWSDGHSSLFPFSILMETMGPR